MKSEAEIEALAKQYGGVDYDALAAKFGGVDVPSDVSAPTPDQLAQRQADAKAAFEKAQRGNAVTIPGLGNVDPDAFASGVENTIWNYLRSLGSGAQAVAGAALTPPTTTVPATIPAAPPSPITKVIPGIEKVLPGLGPTPEIPAGTRIPVATGMGADVNILGFPATSAFINQMQGVLAGGMPGAAAPEATAGLIRGTVKDPVTGRFVSALIRPSTAEGLAPALTRGGVTGASLQDILQASPAYAFFESLSGPLENLGQRAAQIGRNIRQAAIDLANPPPSPPPAPAPPPAPPSLPTGTFLNIQRFGNPQAQVETMMAPVEAQKLATAQVSGELAKDPNILASIGNQAKFDQALVNRYQQAQAALKTNVMKVTRNDPTTGKFVSVLAPTKEAQAEADMMTKALNAAGIDPILGRRVSTVGQPQPSAVYDYATKLLGLAKKSAIGAGIYEFLRR